MYQERESLPALIQQADEFSASAREFREITVRIGTDEGPELFNPRFEVSLAGRISKMKAVGRIKASFSQVIPYLKQETVSTTALITEHVTSKIQTDLNDLRQLVAQGHLTQSDLEVVESDMFRVQDNYKNGVITSREFVTEIFGSPESMISTEVEEKKPERTEETFLEGIPTTEEIQERVKLTKLQAQLYKLIRAGKAEGTLLGSAYLIDQIYTGRVVKNSTCSLHLLILHTTTKLAAVHVAIKNVAKTPRGVEAIYDIVPTESTEKAKISFPEAKDLTWVAGLSKLECSLYGLIRYALEHNIQSDSDQLTDLIYKDRDVVSYYNSFHQLLKGLRKKLGKVNISIPNTLADGKKRVITLGFIDEAIGLDKFTQLKSEKEEANKKRTELAKRLKALEEPLSISRLQGLLSFATDKPAISMDQMIVILTPPHRDRNFLPQNAYWFLYSAAGYLFRRISSGKTNEAEWQAWGNLKISLGIVRDKSVLEELRSRIKKWYHESKAVGTETTPTDTEVYIQLLDRASEVVKTVDDLRGTSKSISERQIRENGVSFKLINSLMRIGIVAHRSGRNRIFTSEEADLIFLAKEVGTDQITDQLKSAMKQTRVNQSQ